MYFDRMWRQFSLLMLIICLIQVVNTEESSVFDEAKVWTSENTDVANSKSVQHISIYDNNFKTSVVSKSRISTSFFIELKSA